MLAGRAAVASFHVAVIDELATRVDGDPAQQFVEIRMLANLQAGVAGTVLAAFDAEGGYLGDLLVVPADVPSAGAGLRWTMATEAFQEAHAFPADFTFPPGRLPVEDGMVCWGAPGITPPDPGSWDHSDPSLYVDCVAYGRFCGSSPGGLAVPATPADHALSRITVAPFTNASFVCSDAFTPRSNAGIALSLPGAPCAPLGPFLCGQPVAGGAPAKTDCFGTWVVRGAAGGGRTVRCRDEDPSCDEGTGSGCFIPAQMCFGLARRGCTPAPVTSVTIKGRVRDDVDTRNAGQVASALAAIGGVAEGNELTFDPPLAPTTCTPPFHLFVPSARRRIRTLAALTRAGKRDRDRLKVVCEP